jgi:hypothetical protein
MKNLRDIDTVAHHWANRVGDSGKASSLWFQGDTLYSYAEPIAKLLPDGTVMHTTRTWSNTTSNHQSKARYAANHLRAVSCRAVQDSPAENMAYARRQVADRLERAEKVFVVRKDGVQTVNSVKAQVNLRAQALHLAEKANAYLEACQRNNLGLAESMIDTTDLESVRAELQRQRAAEDALREAARLRRAESAKEGLALWRTGEGVPHDLHALPVALRLNGDRVQTSYGAEIPVRDARRLWPFLLSIRQGSMGGVTSGFKLGPYTLNRIEANGDIVVGCHQIAFSEMEGIAVQLGLVEKEAS